MSRIMCVANQKGGVGKTTTALNLAQFFALAGERTLLIDLDLQGNASSVLSGDYDGPSLFGGGEPQESGRQNLFCLPAAEDLAFHEGRLSAEGVDGRNELQRRLEPFKESFNHIVIDCPPSLTALPQGALLACEDLVIPIQCEYYAMEGLGQIMGLVDDLRQLPGAALERLHILLCMYDDNLALSREVAAEIRRHLSGQVLKTTIPRDVALAAAPSHGRTAMEHDPLSPGAIAYLEACKELRDVIH